MPVAAADVTLACNATGSVAKPPSKSALIGSSMLCAITGFPLITVPAGYAHEHLPIGITFMGRPWAEATLIRLAHAFEQAHPVRRPPSLIVATLDLP